MASCCYGIYTAELRNKVGTQIVQEYNYNHDIYVYHSMQQGACSDALHGWIMMMNEKKKKTL
jgi:hypothetical protein